MEQFSGAALLDALRCRTLLLYGDASLGEHWQALVCGAHGAAGAQYAVRWDDPGGGRCPHGEQHCAVQAGRASPPPAPPPSAPHREPPATRVAAWRRFDSTEG